MFILILISILIIVAICIYFVCEKHEDFDTWAINRKFSELIDEYNITIKNIQIEQKRIMDSQNWEFVSAEELNTIYKEINKMIEECHKISASITEAIDKEDDKNYRKNESVFEEKLAELNVLYYKLTVIKENMKNISKGYSDNEQLFFEGCSSINELNKRYRLLAKIYHPDSENGNSDIFQKIKDEYDKKIKEL